MIITDKNRDKKLANNILTLSQAAKKAKLLNNKVINATAGMLYDENNTLYTFAAVKKVLKDLSDDHMFAYSDTGGSKRFKDAVIKWVFSRAIDECQETYMDVIATPGGSGAISIAFTNYLNRGDKVLLPKNMWETYITFAKERECGYITYDLYDDMRNFNLTAIKRGIDELNNQDTVVVVINDPCQNPTGFCMKDEEYDALVDLLNSYQRNIVLLMDIAYFDYYSSDRTLIRKKYAKLARLNENILTIFAFSGSKTFGIYGLRIGAAIGMSKNEAEIACFKNAGVHFARGTWSNSSTLGISLIEELVLNKNYRRMFKDELKNVSGMLERRAKIFIEESTKCGLDYLPFECGFFVCIPTPDPVKLMNALYQDDVYVVVTKSCIRIALCSINQEETRKLPHIIKRRMELENL